MTLFEIRNEYHRLVELLTTSDGELPDAVAAEFEAEFAAWEANAGEKADAYIAVIRALETKAAALKAQRDQYQAEADRFKAAADVEANAAERMMERLKDFLTMTGQPKFTTAAGRKLTVKNNSSQSLVLADCIDIDTLPDEFVKVTKSVDSAKVKAELMAGGELPFAMLAPRGSHLLIK